MQITSVITEKVKDAVALSKNIAKVVKEEIELYLDKNNNEEDEDEDEKEEASCEKEDAKSVIMGYIETFETKAKDLIKNSFSGFKSSKTEDQEELEARIAALEEKLSKLVEDSLKAIRK